ncbi:MAG: class II glutamine amidotransferase [Polyangiaceae bacterium]|nr:class II glutamine amidotransferase [Polyangiaceae bacterium]
MARLFGLIGNRADLGGRVLGSEADALRVHSKGTALGWGVGFYQGGEVLMRRRPIDESETIEVAKLAGDVNADMMIGQVQSAAAGTRLTLHTENTPPFRYRQWLYAQAGSVPSFPSIRERLVTRLPIFLKSAVRGETDAEILFAIFLSFLHQNGSLHDRLVSVACVRDALRSSLAVVTAMGADVSHERANLNLVVSNGEHVFAVHAGEPMGYRLFRGKADAEALLPLMHDDFALRRKAPVLDQMRFTLIASDFDDGGVFAASGPASLPASASRWKAVSDRAIVTLERESDPYIEAL